MTFKQKMWYFKVKYIEIFTFNWTFWFLFYVFDFSCTLLYVSSYHKQGGKCEEMGDVSCLFTEFLFSECFPTFIIPSRNLMFALLPWLLCIKLLKINFPRSENDWKHNIKFKKWQNRQSCFSLIFCNILLIDIHL